MKIGFVILSRRPRGDASQTRDKGLSPERVHEKTQSVDFWRGWN
jgi:hypothetical protein